MSDDPSRPLPGSQSDPRPAADAPSWWGSLERADLPLDGTEKLPAAAVRRLPPSTPPRLAEPLRRSIPWRTIAFNAGVLLVALLIVCIGVGVISPSMFLTSALIFGVCV